MGIRHRSIFVDKATAGNIFPVTSDQYHEFRHLLSLLLFRSGLFLTMRNATPKNIPRLFHWGTLAPHQNHLDKRAPIGYNDPISRARLEVNIM